MRILALVGEAYGAPGGIAQYNRDFFDGLSACGEHSIRILPRGGPAGAETPVGVIQERPVFGRQTYAARAFAATLASRPEMIFCGHLYMAPLAHLLAGVSGAKLIIQLHGIESWRTPGAATRRAVAVAERVLCVSRDTRAKLLAWSGLAPERAVVLANTVGPAFTPGDRAAARARWSLDKPSVILAVGRLDSRERYKGQDRVILALATLRDQGLRPLFLIAGDGDDRPRLEALAAAKDLTDQVRFLGRVADTDLPDLYRAADLFALPSTGEGFGIVYLEAMACGTPALGLKAGGAPDALCDGELGVVIEEVDLAEALKTALATKPRLNLPQEVTNRFGNAVFRTRLQAIMASFDDKIADLDHAA